MNAYENYMAHMAVSVNGGVLFVGVLVISLLTVPFIGCLNFGSSQILG